MDGKRRGEIIYTVGTYLLRMYFVIDKNSRREKIHSDNIYTSSIHPLSTMIANKLYALALRDVDPQKVLHTYLGGARLDLNCFPVQPWTSMGPLEKRLLFRPQSKEPTGNVLSYLVANSVWREGSSLRIELGVPGLKRSRTLSFHAIYTIRSGKTYISWSRTTYRHMTFWLYYSSVIYQPLFKETFRSNYFFQRVRGRGSCASGLNFMIRKFH